MQVVDTHCHIHEAQSELDPNDAVHSKWQQAGRTDTSSIIADAAAVGVDRMICVGTDVADSRVAVEFVQSRPQLWASLGIHPHEAKRYPTGSSQLDDFAGLLSKPKVVAIGECGLDYFYNHSPKADQLRLLRWQIELALAHGLPLIFHVREAFEDFWPVFDSYQGIQGVIHSFTASRSVLEQALQRGLYVGLNGIVTFTKDQNHLEAVKLVPSNRLLIETDAPYLTPAPNRGTICKPKHAMTTVAFIAKLRGETDQQIADQTTANACRLFNLPAANQRSIV